MEILQAILLGFVQGVTEVLPISSSAHLVLMPWFFNFKDPGLSFDVALHLGTLVAILVYFNKDILNIVKGGVGIIRKKDPSDLYQKLFIFLIIGTIPGVLAGFFLNDLAESEFRSPLLIAGMVFVFAIILFFADRYGERANKKKTLDEMKAKNAIAIGLAQAVAIVPGVSRSGVTMTAGLFSKMKREEAARFSFILSVPIIVGAFIFKIRDLSLEQIFSAVFIFGFLSALLAAFLSVRFLMNFVKTHNFNIFVVYRIGLAALIVIIYFLRN